MSKAFDWAQIGLDAERLNLHGLRHTAATLMLTAGQPVHEVARYLGHSPQVLLTSYSHVLRGRQEQVASTMSAVLKPAPSSNSERETSNRGAIDTVGPKLAPSECRTRAASPQRAGFVGRPSGLEPLTPGATVRCSTN